MKKILKVAETIQPLIIALLVLCLILQKRDNDTFIEDRDREIKIYTDSLDTVNRILYNKNTISNSKIKMLEQQKSINDTNLTSIDNSIEQISNDHEEEIHTVDNLSTDDTILLLTINLSEEDVD